MALQSPSIREMSAQMKDMRSQMEENEQLSALMASLRGKNLSDADFADDSVQMRLVDVGGTDGEDLPLVYDPETITEYWGRRPVAVTSRIIQLLSE
jgi:aarF domain-containing kinase